MPPYRRSTQTPLPPGPPGPQSAGDDRAYLWMAVAIGCVPLVGAVVCRRWSDTELGAGTALVAIAGPALVRSYRKGD